MSDEFRGHEHALLSALGINWYGSRKVSGKIRCPFPDHEDKHPSWRWTDTRPGGGAGWICTCGGGDIIDAVYRMGFAHSTASSFNWCRRMVGDTQRVNDYTLGVKKTTSEVSTYQPATKPPTLAQISHPVYRRPAAVYLYHNADGQIAEVRARYEHDGGKDVLPWTYDGKRWHARQMPGARPLYRLPELLAAPDKPVLVVEGEGRKCERAQELFPDCVVTSCSGGCKAAAGMDFSPLADRSVVIWPDNDEPGLRYARDVCECALSAGAKSARIVNVPHDWPAAWDLGDEPPGDAIDLREMLDEARIWATTPTTPEINPDFETGNSAEINPPKCRAVAGSTATSVDAEKHVAHESVSAFETTVEATSKASLRQSADVIPFSTLSSAAAAPSPRFKEEPAATSKFKLTRFRDIEPILSGQWLIKGLLPSRGLCTVFGEPGCGKSFLTLDMVLHVAAGRDYAGRKTKQARVVYIAAEGQGGFRNRIIEGAKALELDGTTQFDLIEVAPNLGVKNGDAAELIKAIEDQAEDGDSLVGAIVIDTTSQTMGGENENLEGMATFIVNANMISTHFQCLSIALHHVGKTDTQTPRGWSGLHGANDTEIKVTGLENPHGAQIVKQKDGELGLSFQFNLHRIEIGADEDGDAVTTCIVEKLDAPVAASDNRRAAGTVRLTRRQREFDTAFADALLASGDDYYIDGDGPMVRAVYVHQIRPYFAKRWATDEQDKRARQKKTSDAFKSALKTLPPKYHTRTGADGERIWRTS